MKPATPGILRKAIVPVVISLLISGCASTGAGPGIAYRGGVLTDAKGMTVYTYLKDSFNKSNCTGQCEANWPPLRAAANEYGMDDLRTFKRDDGTLQWAFDGKPLYLWIKDAKPGDKTGQGVANAWSTVIEPPTPKVVSDY